VEVLAVGWVRLFERVLWIVGRLARVVDSRSTLLVEYLRRLRVVRMRLWRDSLSRRSPSFVSMRVGGR
jgi:hypothetical protein